MYKVFGKKEPKEGPPRHRDENHCDLCGSTVPAVRCDKCAGQIFCLSCDDMYHRHPKRKHHLRKAVDSIQVPRPPPPPTSTNKPPPGDPSKMPVAPPRKKKPKSFLGSFVRGGSSSPVHSPSTPRKESSFGDKLGSIKRFMINRPLPPLPTESPSAGSSSDSSEPLLYQNVENRLVRHHSASNPNLAYGGASEDQPLLPPKQNPPSSFMPTDTLRRNFPSFRPPSGLHKPSSQNNLSGTLRSGSPSPLNSGNGGHALSASVTDLQSLTSSSPQPGAPYHYPPHPMGYPPFSPLGGHSLAHLNCPECYFHPLMGPGDTQTLKPGAMGTVKRSHSVHPDFPPAAGGYYHHPFLPPGYSGFPFYPPHPHFHHPAPPSPTLSVRSQQQYRHQDDSGSVASSSRRSRTKSSSSERALPRSTSSEHTSPSRSRRIHTSRSSRSRRTETSDDDDSKLRDSSSGRGVDDDDFFSINDGSINEGDVTGSEGRRSESWVPDKTWQCQHCTFENKAGTRICEVCCKTASYNAPLSSKPETPSEEGSKIQESKPQGKRIIKNRLKLSKKELENLKISGKSSTIERQDGKKDKLSSPSPIPNGSAKTLPAEKPQKVSPIQVKQASPEIRKQNGIPSKLDVDQLTLELEEAEKVKTGGASDPKPAEPPKEWECEHCTFINKPGTRICDVCCKTSFSKDTSTEDKKDGVPQDGLAICNDRKPAFEEVQERDAVSGMNNGHLEKLPSSKGSSSNLSGVQNGFAELPKIYSNVNSGAKMVPKGGNNIDKSGESKSGQVKNSTSEPVSEEKKQLSRGLEELLRLKVANSAQIADNEAFPLNNHASHPSPPNVSSSPNFIPQSTSSMQDAMSPASTASSTHPAKPSTSQSSPTLTSPTSLIQSLKIFKQGSASSGSPAKQSPTVVSSPPTTETSLPQPSSSQNGQRSTKPSLVRSLSRPSLLGSSSSTSPRLQQRGPNNLGNGLSFVRSLSRTSLMNEPQETSWPESPREPLKKPAFHHSVGNLNEKPNRENLKLQGLELVRMIREAEKRGYKADDLQAAFHHCGPQSNALAWLEANWESMIMTVRALADNAAPKGPGNAEVTPVSREEALRSLRKHKGNVWAAVTECVEAMQNKVKGEPTRNDVKNSAPEFFQKSSDFDFTKPTQPFMMKIWGPGSGVENQANPSFFLGDRSPDELSDDISLGESASGAPEDTFSDIICKEPQHVQSRKLSLQESMLPTFGASFDSKIKEEREAKKEGLLNKLMAIQKGHFIKKESAMEKPSSPKLQGDGGSSNTPSETIMSSHLPSIISERNSSFSQSEKERVSSPAEVVHSSHEDKSPSPQGIISDEANKNTETINKVSLLSKLGFRKPTSVGDQCQEHPVKSFVKPEEPVKNVSLLQRLGISQGKKENASSSSEHSSAKPNKESTLHSPQSQTLSERLPDQPIDLSIRSNDATSKQDASISSPFFIARPPPLDSPERYNDCLIDPDSSSSLKSISLLPSQDQLSQTGSSSSTFATFKTSDRLTPDASKLPSSSSNRLERNRDDEMSFSPNEIHPRNAPSLSEKLSKRILNTKERVIDTHSNQNNSDELSPDSLMSSEENLPMSFNESDDDLIEKEEKKTDIDLSVGDLRNGSLAQEKAKDLSSSRDILKERKQIVIENDQNSLRKNNSDKQLIKEKEDMNLRDKLDDEGEKDEKEGSQKSISQSTIPFEKTDDGDKAKDSKPSPSKNNLKLRRSGSLVSSMREKFTTSPFTKDDSQIKYPKLTRSKSIDSQSPSELNSEKPRENIPKLTSSLQRPLGATNSSSIKASSEIKDLRNEAESFRKVERGDTPPSKSPMPNDTKGPDGKSDKSKASKIPSPLRLIEQKSPPPSKNEANLPSGPKSPTEQGANAPATSSSPSPSPKAFNPLLSKVGIVRPRSPTPLRKEERTQDSFPRISSPLAARKPTKKIVLQPKPSKKDPEFERKVKALTQEGKCKSIQQAEMVARLMDMSFTEEDAIQASRACSSIEAALNYLQQECEICFGKYPASQMEGMMHCAHRACRDCLRQYFTIQIRDRNIMELLCPYCNEPDLKNEEVAQDYFNHLDLMLKKLVDEEVHELFQQKLRDRVLMKDPNFRWCSKCSSGFIIANPWLKKFQCPDCGALTCATCRKPWEVQHEGITCEAFQTWKEANDPESQAMGVAKHLTENGIDCPNCHFRYSLARGGCMHFCCIQCQYDFCSGCGRPFKMGQKCTVSNYCEKLGLHAHHPRNCLFYLRDKDPEDLQALLDAHEISYDKEDKTPQSGNKTKCQVMEQKEGPDGWKDDTCNREVGAGFAGLCRIHYVEYLGQKIWQNHLDPIYIFSEDDLELVLRRANRKLPPKQFRESAESYRQRLIEIIEKELPLDKVEGS